MNYFKVALRIQARYKWFALINVAGLSISLMCSLVILLYVNFHLSTDSFHDDMDRIYRLVLDIHTPGGTVEYEEGSALPVAEALHHEYSQIEKTAFCMKFYSAPTITVQGAGRSDRYKEENVAAYADSNFLMLMSHHFIAGDKRTALAGPRRVVLTQRQAVKYFGTADAIGRSLNINNKADLTVTGVIADPPDNSDLKFDVLVSLSTLQDLNPKYQRGNFTWIGSNNWTFIKLKEGAGMNELNSQLPAFTAKYLGGDFSHWHFHLQPLSEMHFDIRYGGTIKKIILWILAGVATALITIVCINYINLSIAQSIRRAKEIGIRKYLGGSRMQLFVQFMSETGMIVFLSICTGLAASYLVLPLINAWMQVDLTLMQLAIPDKMIWLFCASLGLILLAGYYPAVILSGFDPIKAIAGKTGKVRGVNHILRKSLICFQYAVALLFLISTFIIVNQVNYLLKSDLGFSRDAIMTVKLPKSDFSRLETFRNELMNIPGVTRACLQHQAPLSVTTDGGFIRYDNRAQWEDFIVRDRWADDQFTGTYSLELMAGRNIAMADSVTEVLINETLLKKLNLTEPDEVLGKRIFFDNSATTGTIVGVARDFHHQTLQGGIEPLAIYPVRGVLNQAGIKFSTRWNDQSHAALEAAWKRNFPDDVLEFAFLDQSISGMYHVEQVTGKLMKVFAVVSIIICCMGILGLSAFSTLQRTKEIGIRKVLGATTYGIIFLLSGQYLVLLAIAFMVAVPVTYALMHQWLAGFAYHVSMSWLVFVIPGLLMVIIALALVGGQSFKAAITNPAKALKQE